MSRLRCRPSVGIAFLLVGFEAAAAAADFQHDVRPILAEHCGHCHGPDEAARQGGLRLDDRSAALAGGDSGSPAIMPQDPGRSELIRRVTSTDENVVMPPPDAKKPLSPEQIRTLEAWIAAGAEYSSHWVFVPPRAPTPTGDAPHPIDAFVRNRLEGSGLEPAPPADAATLCRRLHLDLVGLPPSPDDLTSFARDGCEETVDRLLASEAYGEHWARPWLDLARYSDTNGYEKDLKREMWAWRDWVIAALNRDLPYDTFVIQQIAGDLLPSPTQDQIVATGFLRNSMLNEEGAIIPEEFRMVEMFDRMDCLGRAVLGLSTQCAQCHSHKFDPLSQDEYYGMVAFLNNSYEAKSFVYEPTQLDELATIRREVTAAESRIRELRPGWEDELATWERGVVAALLSWTPVVMDEMHSAGLLTHPTHVENAAILMLGHRDQSMIFESVPALRGATGIQVEALCHGDLLMGGPGRDGSWALSDLKVEVRRPGSDTWEAVKLVHPSADFESPEHTAPKPNAKDARLTLGPVAALTDESGDTAWEADRGELLRHQPAAAVVQFEKPLDLPTGTRLRVSLQNLNLRPDFNHENTAVLGCCRISLTKAPAPVAPAVDHAAVLAMRTPPAQRTPADKAALFTAWRRTVPELASVNAEIAALWGRVPRHLTTVMHLAERPPEMRRVTRFLDRGGWNQPRHEVTPRVPAALHAFPADAPLNRLGFARWLVAHDSPLAARVAVNRIWQAMFGAGLVETPDDFGTRAPTPEHRDVLDWLAVDFVNSGWSQKRLIRTIVMSQTYQQSSRVSAEALARDPLNRLLARGPRGRVDAEVVRDVTLSAAGLLTNHLGGPGVIPPVPQNVLDYNFFYPDYWRPAAGADRYRRGVYLFRKRSMPDPVLTSFDAPNGDISCARRPRSNTPLAALTSWNEPVFVEAARALAIRLLREAGPDDASRARLGFVLCTSREPTAAETAALADFVRMQRQRLADGWLSTQVVASGGGESLPPLPPGVTPQDAAAWVLASRVLLNLDETLTKN